MQDENGLRWVVATWNCYLLMQIQFTRVHLVLALCVSRQTFDNVLANDRYVAIRRAVGETETAN